MKKEWGIAIVVVGVLLVGAGFYPLSREIKFEEKGAREETWWREETRYKEVAKIVEESYTETVEKKIIAQDAVLFERRGDALKDEIKETYSDLKEGELIHIIAKGSSDIVIFFFLAKTGCHYLWTIKFFQGIWTNTWTNLDPKNPCIYQGKSINQLITLPFDGEYSFEVRSADLSVHPHFDIRVLKAHWETKTETVTKTRQIEVKVQEPYIVKTPYTTQVPYTIVTERTEKFNIEAFRYAGPFLILAGAFVFWKSKP